MLDANGDYSFGNGGANFLVNSAATVAQSVLTRLRLWTGEWFLDVTEGTPYMQKVLGSGTKALYDLAIQQRVLATNGVTGILKYASALAGRNLSVAVTVSTQFGPVDLQTVL
jgi:hypothetical protein